MGEWSDKEDASNLEKGLLSMPVEITTEILGLLPHHKALHCSFSS